MLFHAEDTKKKAMLLLEQQRDYKMAALRAKKQGDLDQARLYLRTSKVRVRRRSNGSGEVLQFSFLRLEPSPGGPRR